MNHQAIDRCSLMMHRIIAARLRALPELFVFAHAQLVRWNCPERHRLINLEMEGSVG